MVTVSEQWSLCILIGQQVGLCRSNTVITWLQSAIGTRNQETTITTMHQASVTGVTRCAAWYSRCSCVCTCVCVCTSQVVHVWAWWTNSGLLWWIQRPQGRWGEVPYGGPWQLSWVWCKWLCPLTCAWSYMCMCLSLGDFRSCTEFHYKSSQEEAEGSSQYLWVTGHLTLTHTHTHTHTHAHTHACTHTHTHTHARTHTHTHTCMCTVSAYNQLYFILVSNVLTHMCMCVLPLHSRLHEQKTFRMELEMFIVIPAPIY